MRSTPKSTTPAQIVKKLTADDIEAWVRRQPRQQTVGRCWEPGRCLVAEFLHGVHGLNTYVFPYAWTGDGAPDGDGPAVEVDLDEMVALPEPVAALARSADALGDRGQRLTAATVLHELFGEETP